MSDRSELRRIVARATQNSTIVLFYPSKLQRSNFFVSACTDCHLSNQAFSGLENRFWP
jgi:hypothetical protein